MAGKIKRKMRNVFSMITLFVTLLMPLPGCNDHDHKKTVKTYQLPPRGNKIVSFKAEHTTRVAFVVELPGEQRAKCKNNCIRLKYVDSKGIGEAVTSNSNANVDIPPEKGKIIFTVENLETFPIKVIVTWK